jgi:hypothetical protein
VQCRAVNPTDAAELTALEESLWRAETRFDRDHLERIYTDDFTEFGQSGRIWTRIASMSAAEEPFVSVLPLPSLRIMPLGQDAALLTYRSDTTYSAIGVRLVAHRSSVWVRTDEGWKMRFHQGTAAA